MFADVTNILLTVAEAGAEDCVFGNKVAYEIINCFVLLLLAFNTGLCSVFYDSKPAFY